MVFTQRSIRNLDSPDVEENRSERTELHLAREHPFWAFSTDLNYLGLSSDLKSVGCHLLLLYHG